MALEMGNISGFAMGIVGSGVIVGIGVYVVATMKSNLAVTGNATTNPSGVLVNATFDNTISGAGAIPGWFPVLVVAGLGFLALSFFVNRA